MEAVRSTEGFKKLLVILGSRSLFDICEKDRPGMSSHHCTAKRKAEICVVNREDFLSGVHLKSKLDLELKSLEQLPKSVQPSWALPV